MPVRGSGGQQPHRPSIGSNRTGDSGKTGAPAQLKETGAKPQVGKPKTSQGTQQSSAPSSQSQFTKASTTQATNSPTLPQSGSTEKAPRGSSRPKLQKTQPQQGPKPHVQTGSPSTQQTGGQTPQLQISRPTLSTQTAPAQPQSMKYEDINRLSPNFTKPTMIDGYRMVPTGRDGKDIEPWAEFKKPRADETLHWKAHLNFSKADLPKAWDIIYPELVKNEVPAFKVARGNGLLAYAQSIQDPSSGATKEERTRAMNDLNRGSETAQVTLYIPPGQEKHMQGVMANLEKKLKDGGVRPGDQDPRTTRQIGQYTAVRYESDKPVGETGRKYISYDKADSYNPANVADPFKNLGKYK